MKEKRKMEAGEAELVQSAKAGDLDAFEQLVTRYEQRIYGLARRITGSDDDAQDVTQQTFLSAMQNLSRFRGKSSFITWLATIAANAALKVVRKRHSLSTRSLDEATAGDAGGRIPHPEFIADWRENPERLIHKKETQRLLDSAISKLSPDYRTVFLLRDVEELSVRDTARALNISENNVKVRLMRARLHLREQLTRFFGDKDRRYVPVDHSHNDPSTTGEQS